MNKRDDARKLKPAAQHMLRRQVVNAVRDGMKQVEAARVFRASLRAVSKWLRWTSCYRRRNTPQNGRFNFFARGSITI